MKSLPFLLAWRYLWGTKNRKNISAMVLISFAGIAIGTFALALTLFVMHGFETVTLEKLQGMHAQIVMRAYGDALNIEAIAPILETEFPEIAAFSPTTIKQAIIQNIDSNDITNVIMLKGVDPQRESRMHALEQKIITDQSEKSSLPALITDEQIIIGKKLATDLDVVPGDKVRLLYTPDSESQSRKIRFEQKEVTVSALFSTGIDEFDSGMAYASLDLMDELWPDEGITAININLQKTADEENAIEKLQDRFHVQAYSWKELYPALVSAMKLEKYVMFFILALIILVASMNIISLEFMQITQKRGDIAILKAMGMNDSAITIIFLSLGLIVSTVASLTGLLLALGAGWFLETYPFITLPDAYYVSHLPIRMEWYLCVLVFALVLVLSFIATYLPARATRSIRIADILRFEA